MSVSPYSYSELTVVGGAHPSLGLSRCAPRLSRCLTRAIRCLSLGRRPVDDRQRQASDGDASELIALRQQVENLQQAVRARDDFIAIAAHELRNPMTPIAGLTELALAAARKAVGLCPPLIMDLLERLQFAVQEFIKRATRLLDVGRIEAGNLRLEPSLVALSTLVLGVVQRYDVAAKHGDNPIDLDVEQGVVGTWDPLAVEQVLENLLSNGLKFGSGKPVTVRLRSDGRFALLQVQDRGIGMQPDEQACIFGRFEQVMSQHRRSGFGIGLWVSNKLVTAMGGRITVASRVGDGSTFAISLPLAPSELEQPTA
jgi:two-component system OmpR family sensor kinase